MKRGAAQQGDEPVEALELKTPQGGPCVIDVRFAGYRQCWTDPEEPHAAPLLVLNEGGEGSLTARQVCGNHVRGLVRVRRCSALTPRGHPSQSASFARRWGGSTLCPEDGARIMVAHQPEAPPPRAWS
jgi:hypothetical protein